MSKNVQKNAKMAVVRDLARMSPVGAAHSRGGTAASTRTPFRAGTRTRTRTVALPGLMPRTAVPWSPKNGPFVAL